jgi:outer membrane protein TolC
MKQSHLETEREKAFLKHHTVWENPEVEVAFDNTIDGSMDAIYMEISQPLPSWGEVSAMQKYSEASVQKALYSKERTKLEVSYQAAELYRKLYHQKRKLRTLQKQLNEANRLLEVVKRREESGDMSGIERSRISIGLHRLKVNVANEKSGYFNLLSKAQTMLKKKKIKVNSPIKHDALKPMNLLTSHAMAHPHLDTLRANLETKKYTLDLAQSKMFAMPELFIYQEKEAGISSTTNEIRGGGIRMRIPLWNQNHAHIEMQKVEKLKASHKLMDATFQLKQQNNRYLKLYKRSKEQQYTYKKTVLTPSKQLYELSKTLFESGEKSLLEMLDAQAFYFSSELEYNLLVSHYDKVYLNLCESFSINLIKDHHE